MLLSHLFLEGIGPFKTLHLDLRGNDAHASPGPHILAGVNGSGKSTVLKSIAWCLATADDGFPFDEWVHFLKSYPQSRAMVVFDKYEFVSASASDHAEGWEMRLGYWVGEKLISVGLDPDEYPLKRSFDLRVAEEEDAGLIAFRLARAKPRRAIPIFGNARYGGKNASTPGALYSAAAYSSARAIKFVENLDMALPQDKARGKRFAFESTVQNEAIQSWLLALYSKRAIAKERRESRSLSEIDCRLMAGGRTFS
jgi:hypothetical protein